MSEVPLYVVVSINYRPRLALVAPERLEDAAEHLARPRPVPAWRFLMSEVPLYDTP